MLSHAVLLNVAALLVSERVPVWRGLLATLVFWTVCVQVRVVSAYNLPVWKPGDWKGPEPINPFSPHWPNSVAICSMMKEENFDDIEEWLGYHRRIGVDKVFLYEDTPSIFDGLQSFLQPWINAGFLQLQALNNTELAYVAMQPTLHNRCSKPDIAGAYSWVMAIDLDEYLIIMEDGKASTNPRLKEVLTAFRNNAGIALQNIGFGSSGHIARPSPGGPLRHYTSCTAYPGPQFKNLANTYWLVGMGTHSAYYRFVEDPMTSPIVRASGAPVVAVVLNETVIEDSTYWMYTHDRLPGTQIKTHSWGVSTEYNQAGVIPTFKLILFHYVTRSQDDYFGRKLRITKKEASSRGTFPTSLFGGAESLEALDENWFRDLQASRFPREGGICAEAVNANYADAAQQESLHVRGLTAT